MFNNIGPLAGGSAHQKLVLLLLLLAAHRSKVRLLLGSAHSAKGLLLPEPR